jgi:hypothetical protein
MRPFFIQLAVALCLVSSLGCSHGGASLRKTFARAHSCKASEVTVLPSGGGYVVEGCGTREVCSSARGPCTPDAENLMLRARATFASMKQCPEFDVQVSPTAEGIAVSGCGSYAICPGSATNCFAAAPPTCRDGARRRFDDCSRLARREGMSGRDSVYGGGTAVAATSITNSITGTVAEDRQLNSCQSSYSIELERCRD